jgi:hypothetical protein
MWNQISDGNKGRIDLPFFCAPAEETDFRVRGNHRASKDPYDDTAARSILRSPNIRLTQAVKMQHRRRNSGLFSRELLDRNRKILQP